MATAPDGTSVIMTLGTGPGSTAEIDARVQRAGTTSWATVPPRVKNQGDIQDFALTAAPDSIFWLAWTTYVGAAPEVYAMKLNPVTRKWSAPVQVFHDTGFGHASPLVAIGGDGTVGIVAEAEPSVTTNPPVYRVEVAMLRPGKDWTTRFMTPADAFANDPAIAANPSGEFAVSWLQGYEAGAVTAATRAAGASAPWHTATLSVANDSQRQHLAIGPNGTVAVAWSAPTEDQTAERLSTTTIGAGTPAWTRRDLVTSITAGLDAYPVVYRNGDVTVVWGEGASGDVWWTSTLTGGTLSAPVQFTPDGNPSYVAALGLRPDGRAGVLYQRFGGTPDNEGMSYLTFTDGVMSPTLELTDAPGDSSFSDSLGVDAASESTVIVVHGSYPATNVTWMSNRRPQPSVMTSAYSGHAVSRARITGHLRVHRTLHCVTGLWVGARTVRYSWLRNGKKIAHRSAAKYRVVHADLHKRLSCVAIGSNASGGHRTVKSKKHRIT
jgi:hypothetical protein